MCLARPALLAEYNLLHAKSHVSDSGSALLQPQPHWQSYKLLGLCTGLATCKLQPQQAFLTKVCSTSSDSAALFHGITFVPRRDSNKLAGVDSGTACAEAVFSINQTKVSVTLTSTGLQFTKLNSGFPGFGRRHIPASGQLLSSCHRAAAQVIPTQGSCHNSFVARQ